MSKFAALGLLSACLAAAAPALAEGPPSVVPGVIGNPTLVANQQIAKAQAVGAIIGFMSQGAQECDANGQNCHSPFGADGNLDYVGMQTQAQATTGTQAFNFLDSEGNSSNVTAQVATLALACGDTKSHLAAGVAIKASSCIVSANGDAQLTFKVCTAPSRNLPVATPANAMPCSTDPTQPNFKPSAGKVCAKPSCDTEPVGSLNGWSADVTISWQVKLPSSATDAQKTNNGLGLVFYPPLGGGVPLDFKADSDNMTAVKIVQSFVNTQTHKTAVGLRIAYRHKATVTKEMIENPASVTNPSDYTGAWDTVTKLQANALIPKYGEKYGKNGSECIQQIQNGIATDGKVYVCDETYTNESGIHPLAHMAKVAVQGQDCGTKEQCLQEVVNTNTWDQTCKADVPLTMHNCTTTQNYTLNATTSTQTKATEICHEKRTTAVYSCTTSAAPGSATLADFTTPPTIGGTLSATVTHVGTGQYHIDASLAWGGGSGSYGSFTFYLDSPAGQLVVTTLSTDDAFVMAHRGLTFMVGGASGSYSMPLQTGSALGPTKSLRKFVAGPMPITYNANVMDCSSYDMYGNVVCTSTPTPTTITATAQVSEECFNHDIYGSRDSTCNYGICGYNPGFAGFVCNQADHHTYFVQSFDMIDGAAYGSYNSFDLVQGANTVEVAGRDPSGMGGVYFSMDIVNYVYPTVVMNGCSGYEAAQ